MTRVRSSFPWLFAIALSMALLSGPQELGATDCGNPNDNSPDDTTLQACLDVGGTISLVPGSPGFIIAQGVVIKRSDTRLGSTGPGKATLKASSTLENYMLSAEAGLTGYEVSNLIIDGDRDSRDVRDSCYDGAPYANAVFQGNFWVHHVNSIRAVCGSGMGLMGSGYMVTDNYIADNGRPKGSGSGTTWSDGMTVLSCNGGSINNNTFADNTDIDLVVGGGNCSIQGNSITHFNRYGFAGLAVGSFDGNGNHSGSTISGNTIHSGYNLLSIGLLIGTHPWSTDPYFDVQNSGNVVGNAIDGAVINLVVEGMSAGNVGVSGAPNTMFGAQGDKHLAPSGCVSTNYSAHHFDGAIQDGWFSMEYDNAMSDNPCVPQG